MLRLLVTVVLGSAIALGAAWYFDLLPGTADTAAHAPNGGGHAVTPPAKLGRALYPPAGEAQEPAGATRRTGPDPIVVPGCHMVPIDKQEVASQKDGQLAFVGQQVTQEDPNNPSQTFTITIRVGDQEQVITYRELDRSSLVLPGQLVALIDPTLALAELGGLRAKKHEAEAETRAAESTYREAQAKVRRLDAAGTVTGRMPFAIEEYAQAKLMEARYSQEVVTKQEAIKLAQAEINKAEAVYRQHEIRNHMPGAGVIKTIYRKRGDTVKAQEPIMQLYGLERLRAEGEVSVQYLDRLQEKARVSLEPVVLEAPWQSFPGHRGEINAVAFSGRGPDLRIVSASEDRTVAVWGPGNEGGALRIFHHPEAVRVVACTPPAFKYRWCVSGCADGSLRLWDLDGKSAEPRWVVRDPDKGAHAGAVTALAFSPDGRFFASGGEDGMIHLWRTDAGTMAYPFDAEHGAEEHHEGPITALHFTPQARLVSASLDNTLRVWSLKERGAVMDPHVIRGRQGNVPALGVSADGGRMLFDQGRRLQVLSVAEADRGRTLGSLEATFATPFEALALFSPDASLVLTAGAPEGRMQLWKAPTAAGRAFEVRELATKERARVTCAAFAPDVGAAADGSFAVSGTEDGTVYLWRMPTRQQVEQHRIPGLRLTQVDRALDANARQVRIGVDVRNFVDAQHPYGRLMPGRPVTVVIEP